MYETNISDYDNIAHYDNFTNDYNITDDYTNNENNIDIFLPKLLIIIPCGLSFLCLISLLVCTLIKPLFNDKR